MRDASQFNPVLNPLFLGSPRDSGSIRTLKFVNHCNCTELLDFLSRKLQETRIFRLRLTAWFCHVLPRITGKESGKTLEAKPRGVGELFRRFLFNLPHSYRHLEFKTQFSTLDGNGGNRGAYSIY